MLGVGGSIHYSRVESALNATKSVSLDGTNDFIDCSDAIANSVKLIGSVSIWVKMDTGASNDAIWAMGTDTSNDNKLKIYVNGTQVTNFSSTPNYPSLSEELFVNNTDTHFIGRELAQSVAVHQI